MSLWFHLPSSSRFHLLAVPGLCQSYFVFHWLFLLPGSLFHCDILLPHLFSILFAKSLISFKLLLNISDLGHLINLIQQSTPWPSLTSFTLSYLFSFLSIYYILHIYLFGLLLIWPIESVSSVGSGVFPYSVHWCIPSDKNIAGNCRSFIISSMNNWSWTLQEQIKNI